MKYLLNKNNEVITTADDEYEFMLVNLLKDFPDSKILSYVPKPILTPAEAQPETTNTIQL